MALLMTNPDGSYVGECALCDQQLTSPIFATTHFITDASDRLYPYSDAAMHFDCYANWKYQRRFANQYYQFARQHKAANSYWGVIADTETYLLAANPNLAEPMAHLDLQAIGPGFTIPIADWSQWLNGGWESNCVHDLQRYAVIEIEDQLRQAIPDSETLLRMARERVPQGA